MSLAIRKYIRPSELPRHLRDFAKVAPLFAGVLAPFSVLLDIPALTEPWYRKDGESQKDPKTNVVISGLSLGFGVLANALLVIRFSLQGHRWRKATAWSVVFWFLKVALSTTNLIVFGAFARNQDTFTYDEGFWCTVISDIVAGIAFALLICHFVDEFVYRRREKKDPQVRVYGRHFMLEVTLWIGLMAISGAIFSKLEHWSYLDGIYFTMVNFLTIGYGDLLPTTTASRIVLFPIALVGIALLGSLIQMLVAFFAARSANRKARSRAKFERQRQIEEDRRQNPADLAREIEFLHTMNEKQDLWDQFTEFAASCFGFFAFWVVGAAIFMALEGWTYGSSMYFLYITFLTIGLGDMAPTSPAGRVVFLVYALIAVPVMASFAVEAITQVITRVSQWRLDRRKVDAGVEPTSAKDHSPPVSHAEFVARHARRWEDKHEEDDARDMLLRDVLEQAVALEAHARRLLISHLPNGSKAQVVLKADRNVQMRDVRAVQRAMRGGEGERGSSEDVLGDADSVSRPLGEEETVDEVNRYRECFAAVLAAGSRIRGLDGLEQALMERRRAGEDQQQDGWDKERSLQAEKEAVEKTL